VVTAFVDEEALSGDPGDLGSIGATLSGATKEQKLD
jgi:hypothetical protein